MNGTYKRVYVRVSRMTMRSCIRDGRRATESATAKGGEDLPYHPFPPVRERRVALDAVAIC